MRKFALLAAAIPLLLGLAACGADTAPPNLDRFYDQQLTFGPCAGYATTAADEQAFTGDPALQCARLEVPLDHTDPDGRTLSIAVLKAPARGERLGSLLLNPGGPGGPGMSMAAVGAQTLAQSPVTERFDLIGFDPRGVGASTPAVDCFTDAEIDAGQAITSVLIGPKTLTADDTRRVVERCAAGSGGEDVLAHLGTRDAVRDMDILRAALGDEKLNFLGQSYGTRLGAVYAETFPERVRALVLDSAIDPLKGTDERRLTQYAGFQRSFDVMAAACAATPDCPLGPDPAQATAAFQALTRPLIERPIILADGRPMEYDGAVGSVIAGLYDARAWPVIWKGLTELRAGEGTTLAALGDAFGGRGADGRYGNFTEALFAINCLDEERHTPEQEVELKGRIQQVAPFLDTGLGPEGARDPCESWPAEPTLGYPYATGIENLPPTLTISITGDPTTPYEGGVSLADTLGGALLSVEAEQHTVALGGASPCVNDAVARYLIDLRTPEPGARCVLSG
ncbi:alpha/beta hydrolase [Nocardia sp. NPDC057227]|uniref:alpha/beta hydrolase n=1 Tax=Nocardia sp. NPDC057227 TaxID=3346056 RepID=UPI0036326AC4